MIICYCRNVSEETIVQAIRRGADTLAAIQQETGACTGSRCRQLNPHGRCCSIEIEELINRETGRNKSTKCPCCHTD